MQANKGCLLFRRTQHKECQKVRNVTKCKRLKLTFLSKRKYHTSSLPIGQFISLVSLHPILHGMKMGTTATCEDNNGWSSLHLNDTFFTIVVGEAFYMYLKMFFSIEYEFSNYHYRTPTHVLIFSNAHVLLFKIVLVFYQIKHMHFCYCYP